MRPPTLPWPHQPGEAFRHEAFLYSGQSDFLTGTLSFIGAGLAADEPILVALSAEKIEQLRSGLGEDADSVCFADMAEIGRNPARIIPAWRQFVSEHSGGRRRLRGIGEPIWPGRSPAELAECQRHESLLNLAFTDTPAWWLLCPYDRQALDPAVIAEAYRSHPYIMDGGGPRQSPEYRDGMAVSPFAGPLPERPAQPRELAFEAGPLDAVRRFVSRHAAGAGLGGAHTADLVLAVNELATNSLRHGGGQGILRIWQAEDALVCEIHDGGHIAYPLVGRERPPSDHEGGRGLWLVNQLCDLVQLRSSSAGTVVRLHMRRG